MKWFKHESNSIHEASIEKLIQKYGVEGYGLYYACIELIAQRLSGDNIDFELHHDAETLAIKFKIDTLKVEEIMKFCIKEDLFQFDIATKRVFCLRLFQMLDVSTSQNPEIRKIATDNNYQKLLDSNSRLDKIRLDEMRIEKKKLLADSCESEDNLIKNIKIKEKCNLIEKWNELPGVRKHNNPDAKNYQRIAHYINQLLNGTFIKLKHFDSEWKKKNSITPELLNKVWTEDEIWIVLKNISTLYIEGYWPRDKKKLTKDLATLFFNKVTGTSRFLQLAVNPNKPLKSEKIITSLDESVCERFEKLVRLSKAPYDKNEIIINTNLLIEETQDIISNAHDCNGSAFEIYVGFIDNYKPLLNGFYKFLRTKQESGTTIFPGMLKPNVPTWKSFISWYENFHNNDFIVYPTKQQIKRYQDQQTEDNKKQNEMKKEKAKRELELAYNES